MGEEDRDKGRQQPQDRQGSDPYQSHPVTVIKNGFHISQPTGWDCGQNIILSLVELNIPYPSPGLRKDSGLFLPWCIFWTNQCRTIPSKAVKYKDIVNISGKSCCWRLGQCSWETSLPACPFPTLFSKNIHSVVSNKQWGNWRGLRLIKTSCNIFTLILRIRTKAGIPLGLLSFVLLFS